VSFLQGDDLSYDTGRAPSGPGAAVAVIDADPTVRSRLAMQLGDFAVPLPSLAALQDRLTGTPLVAVLGPSCAGPDGLAAVEEILADRPEVGAVLIAAELSTEIFRNAMRAGIKDVLPAPVDTMALNESIRRVVETLAMPNRPVLSTIDSTPDQHGRIVTVFSTKGGSGKSMIAVNLGVTLARRTSNPVVLLDADLQFGDASVMLKLAPQHTIVDAVGPGDRLDMALLQNLLVRHEPSGLYVLAAPLEPAFADQITAADMVRIVGLLQNWAEFIVVDTPAYFNDVVLQLIELSDDVLLVAGMDIPNIKNVKIGLQTLRLLNTPMSKLRLVLNRSNSKVKLDVNEVERTLTIKAESFIPSDVVVPQSVNKGVPVVLDAPKSGVARSLELLADLFLTADTAKKRR
jgi:pilus assembly protein CpaE